MERAASRKSAMASESRPPCQASGAWPSSSTTSSAVRQQPGVLLGRGQRVQRVGLVARPDHQRGDLEPLEGSIPPSQASERGTSRSAAATASRCSWRSMRCRTAVRTDSRQRSGRESGSLASTNAVDAALLEGVGEAGPSGSPRRPRRGRRA